MQKKQKSSVLKNKTQIKKSVQKVDETPTIQKCSTWTALRAKFPPLFSEDTTREDKLCLFSFCCGIILMASLFFADLFIRNYIETRRWEQQVLQTLLQNRQGLSTSDDKIIIIKGNHSRVYPSKKKFD